MAWIEDRWMKTVPGEEEGTTKQVRSSRYEVGLRYRVRYETADGAERSRSFEGKREAEAFRDTTAADLRRGTYLDQNAGKISLAKFAQEWLDSRTFDDASREATHYRVAHIVAGLGSRRLDQLAASPSAVQAWLRGLKLAPYTARQCFSTLSSICNAAVDDGRMVKNPCHAKSIKLPAMDQRKIVPLEPDALTRMREALPGRYKAMVDAGASCGLRQSEIFALSPDDIGFLTKAVVVHRQVKIVGGKLYFALPKRMKTRTVPLPESASLAFSAHIAEYGTFAVTLPWHEPGTRKHGKPVTVRLMFTSPVSHSPLIRHRFNTRDWKPALLKAGIEATRENGMHVLRHSYASLLLSRGADVNRVADCLGHGDPGFTLRVYGHLREGGEEQVRRLIDQAATGPVPAQFKIV